MLPSRRTPKQVKAENMTRDDSSSDVRICAGDRSRARFLRARGGFRLSIWGVESQLGSTLLGLYTPFGALIGIRCHTEQGLTLKHCRISVKSATNGLIKSSMGGLGYRGLDRGELPAKCVRVQKAIRG